MTESIAPEATAPLTEGHSDAKAAPSKRGSRPMWRSGNSAATMIAPILGDLHPVKALQVDRAYQDFCRLRERGDKPDPDQFCDGFPSIRSALIKLMQCHLYLADNPALAGKEKEEILWPEVGETFLDFDLLQVLGIGSFSRVYLAAEPKLGNRLVAVKVATDFGLAEAKLLGRLKHRNIVPVYSVQDDVDTGLTAVCMPYVGSATLDNVLDHVYSQPTHQSHHILEAVRDLKHPLESNGEADEVDPFLQNGTYIDAVRSIGAQLADALAFIHGLGICHRDLKPSNILISPQGVPMLLDFNLSTNVKDLDNRFGGTLPFMSPEQLQAADPARRSGPVRLDGRSDIFSFGVILYLMLTGKHPFGPVSVTVRARELRQQLLLRHREGASSPRLHNPDIDPAFARLIERCLQHNPNDRPQSAAEIAAALRRDLTPRRPARQGSRRGPRALVSALVLCLWLGLVGAAATVVGPRRPHPMDAGVQLFEQTRFSEAREKFSQMIQANPNDSAALLARAQTYQQMAATEEIYWQYALSDFLAIDKLKPDARNSACIGYCILRTKGPIEWARQRFQSAIDGGFVSAEVYNNLGYCQQQQGKAADAEISLNRAIELDPRMQAAYFTRGLVHSMRTRLLFDELKLKKHHVGVGVTLRGPEAIRAEIVKSLDAGIQDIEKAIAIGPADANLHRWAAQLHAEAAQHGRDSHDAAYRHLREAVRLGLPAKQFLDRGIFKDFITKQQEAALREIAPPAEPAQPMVAYYDPLKGSLR